MIECLTRMQEDRSILDAVTGEAKNIPRAGEPSNSQAGLGALADLTRRFGTLGWRYFSHNIRSHRL